MGGSAARQGTAAAPRDREQAAAPRDREQAAAPRYREQAASPRQPEGGHDISPAEKVSSPDRLPDPTFLGPTYA